ncbi:unnamed protein product [Lymnaea stagnalis]|uniref:G-protein coupled receptors family 2 profile 2 domain-containing protein n=1 Tax=Lymnaea stagnalis TaxID=6523 RepID=A0AAV2IBX5_LYMST
MVTQLEPHPNEPSTFRRAVKAVGVLMPLFGVQFLLFIYRPEDEKNHFVNVYEMTRKVFSSLQGAFIAIVFCYLNKEVRGYLMTSFSRLLGRSGFRHDFASRSVTMTTQYVSDVTRTRSTNGEADPSQMIPLKPVYSSPKMSDRPKGGHNENSLNGDVHFALDQFDEDRPLNPNKSNT